MDKLEAHERECALRFKSIEERLERGSARMDRMEYLLWGVYPFILASVFKLDSLNFEKSGFATV